MKRFFYTALVMMVCAAWFCTTAEAAKYKIKLAHMTPVIEAHSKAGQWIQKEVAKRSNGQMEVQYFHSFQLGNVVEITKKCQMGMIDGAFITGNYMPDLAPEFAVGFLPYLIDSYEKWAKFLANDEMRNQLFQYGEKATGLVFVDQLWFGRYGIDTVKQAKTLEDVSKMKFRATESQINLGMWKAWGVNAETMPWPEVIPALNQKVIDGIDQSNTAVYFMKVDDVCKYVLPTHHVVGTWYIAFNKKSLKKLPEDMKNMLLQVIHEACAQGRVMQMQDECLVREPMKKKGVTFTPLPPDQKEKFVKAIKEKLWPEWRKKAGEAWFDKVQKFVSDVEEREALK